MTQNGYEKVEEKHFQVCGSGGWQWWSGGGGGLSQLVAVVGGPAGGSGARVGGTHW